jgi:hypothetical protein
MKAEERGERMTQGGSESRGEDKAKKRGQQRRDCEQEENTGLTSSQYRGTSKGESRGEIRSVRVAHFSKYGSVGTTSSQ